MMHDMHDISDHPRIQRRRPDHSTSTTSMTFTRTVLHNNAAPSLLSLSGSPIPFRVDEGLMTVPLPDNLHQDLQY